MTYAAVFAFHSLISHRLHAERSPPIVSVHQVLLIILTYLETPADVAAISRTSKGFRDLTNEPFMVANWLWKHEASSDLALPIAASRKGHGSAVMLRLLEMGVSATAATADCFWSTPLQLVRDAMCLTFTPVACVHRLP